MEFRRKLLLPVLVAVLAGLALLQSSSTVHVLAAPPVLSLTATPSTTTVGQQVNFVGQVISSTPGSVTTSATLNFGDGQSQAPQTTGAGFIAQHSYTAAGTYTATLRVTDSNGETGSVSTTVTVTGGCGAPTVTLSASATTADIGVPVTFTFAAVAPTGCATTPALPVMLINFGDGTSPLPLDGPSGSISHAFTNPGTYTVTVTATTGGQTGQAQVTVQVTAACATPSVTLSASPTTATTGQTVTFTYAAVAASNCPSIQVLPTMTINYGDNTGTQTLSAPSGSVTHTFSQTGTFTVTVMATSAGLTGQAQTAVQITGQCSAPTVTVSASPAQATVGQTVTVTYSAAAGAGCTMANAPLPALTINWGDTSGVQNLNGPSGTATHVYNQPGSYNVTVSASSGGQTGTGQATVAVGQAGMPVAVAAGWNLVGGPAGTIIVGNSGPLYTFQAGDTNYRSIPSGTPLQAGWGYWAYFPAATTITVPFTSAQPMTIQAPANQYIMVGNPGNTPATVTGATVVYRYDPSTGYAATTTIPVGGGVWLLSSNGGPVTITP